MGTCALGLVALLASPARAEEPVLVGGDVTAWLPLAAPQSERFGPGGALAGSVVVPWNPWLMGSFRLRYGFLSDGPQPSDPTLRDPGVGGLTSLTLGLRFRPHGLIFGSEPMRGRGGFVEVGAGGGITGSAVRPVFEATLGWGFDLDAVDLAPIVRFTHVLQTSDALDDRSAFLLAAGLELLFLDARPSAALPPVDEVLEAPPETPPVEEARRDDCPDEAEDEDGFRDEDGCPDLDDDEDGIPDARDACRLEPEDLDEVADDDGCPETDYDGDGFLDADDRCPLEAEIVNGVDDTDGCPDEGLIVMIDDRITIQDRVLFDTDVARVRHAAHPVLHAVVELARQHPDWVRLRIEGHADERGTHDYNLRLSQRRAEAVREVLERFGLPSSMLEATGFGDTRPVVEGETPDALRANRRVEIVVVRREP